MSTTKKRGISTQMLTMGSILTAIVVVLQLVAKFTTGFLPVTISLSLIPIVIGAAKCHPLMGGWLGLVSGATILLSLSAEPFFTLNPWATILIVLVKGVASGLLAGLVYRLLKNVNVYLAVIVAAIVCPVVNTGIFFLGCITFFMEEITAWGQAAAFNNTVAYMFLGLAGWNFIFELGTNVAFSPIIMRLLSIKDR